MLLESRRVAVPVSTLSLAERQVGRCRIKRINKIPPFICNILYCEYVIQ